MFWWQWNVKNFAQKLLIGPRSTRHRGGVDRHSTWKLSFLRWGGRGGGSINTQLGSCHFLGGEGGEGGGSIDTQLGKERKTLEGSPLTMLILGGSIDTQLERIREDFGRITSDNADLGGGRLTLNLERIRKDFGRITSDNADPGGGQSTLNWKGSAKTLEGSPQLGRICKDLEGSPQLGKDLPKSLQSFPSWVSIDPPSPPKKWQLPSWVSSTPFPSLPSLPSPPLPSPPSPPLPPLPLPSPPSLPSLPLPSPT